MLGIELFSGPGGMALGAKMAGIKIQTAVEIEPYVADTYQLNHEDTHVIVDNIENVTNFDMKKAEEPVIMFGGPPCQGYSNSNRRTRSIENPKNWLFKQFLRCAKLVMPNWIVIENVKGLVNMKNGFFLEEILNDLKNLGYKTSYKVLNAVNFGVPQKRERIFIVASLKNRNFKFPEPNKDEFITVADAISDLPFLKNGEKNDLMNYKRSPESDYAKKMRRNSKKSTQNYVTKNSDLIISRYKHIPQGGNWKNIPDSLMKNYKDHTRCHHGIYRRLCEKEPSVVIGNYRKNMLVHPNQDRGLSIREAARLQSFPDNYKFAGTLTSKQQQVGNAVPPLLARAVFQQIIKYS